MFFISSCSHEIEKNKNIKKLDFKKFTIMTPHNWTIVNYNGIDSYVKGIAMGNGDTATFDFGCYSNTLTEYDQKIIPLSQLPEMIKNGHDTSGIIFTTFPNFIDRDKIRKQNVNLDTINGYEAKLVYPRKTGRGITGVYFDSLYNENTIGRVRLNLYGTNLTSKNEQLLLNAIQTIKITTPTKE